MEQKHCDMEWNVIKHMYCYVEWNVCIIWFRKWSAKCGLCCFLMYMFACMEIEALPYSGPPCMKHLPQKC